MLTVFRISLDSLFENARRLRAVPLVASIALHAGAVVVGGHAAVSAAADRATAGLEIAIELESVESVSAPDPGPARIESEPTPKSSHHHHAYPVAPSHADVPHSPALVHAPLPERLVAVAKAVSTPASDAQVDVSATEPAPSFHGERLASPRFALRSSQAGLAHTTGPEARFGPDFGQEKREFSEATVDVPARLRAAVAATYPELARMAAVEADVPVEIVVDTAGAVIFARALTNPGYGLESAAVSTARAYRFSPALKSNRPVRVRMRCNVSFRLR